jgi:aspartyl-tRNA(Asn)/glutamyl-tRNA(Gln) amidotransferase subunit C
MKLTLGEVRHVAELAKLELTEEEIRQFGEQLSDILDYAEQIQQVDTGAVPPTPYVLSQVNVMAEDEPQPSFPNPVALANAPDSVDGYFRVKAVFEE